MSSLTVVRRIRGAVIDPSPMERKISDEGLAAARALISLRFPELADAPLVESRVGHENPTDQDFILDHHPQAENA